MTIHARGGAAMIPCLRYRDATAAIAWLCDTFGFERQRVVPGDGDTIAHAQLSLGTGMVMLGSAIDSNYGGRGFSCRDPEGHLWSFGSYDPWA